MRYTISGIIALFMLFFGLAFLIQGSDFFLYRYFSPKYEEVRRKTFEQSKAYNDGMAQELQQMMIDYAGASPEQKDALGAVILHRTAGYDLDRLPPDERDFVVKLRTSRLK